MQPSHFSKILLLALGAGAACGQETPAWIQITAEQSWVIAGRGLKLQAQAFGEFGETLAIPLDWVSSNPAVASVSSSGEVRGALPGRAYIEASARGVSGQFLVSVHPSRIEITPARVDLEAGERSTFSARALDADGQTIGGSDFSWFSPMPPVARIEAGGVVQAVTPGTVTITARMNLPGGGVSFSGQAQVTVRARKPYRAERLVSSDYTTSPVSVKVINSVSYANDRMAFVAGLSNGGQAVMLYENGTARKIAVTGEAISGGGFPIYSFGSVSINARGDVLAYLNLINAPTTLAVFPNGKPASQAELYQQPQQCCYCCMQVSDKSLDNNGDFVYMIMNTTNTVFPELHLRRAGETVRISLENLPGIGRAQWVSSSQVVGGQVVFNANGPTTQGAYLWDGRQVVKLIATGDYVLGKPVQWFDRLIAGGPGEFYTRIGGFNYQMVVRWSAGAWSKVFEGNSTLYDASGGSALVQLWNNDGTGLYRVAGNQPVRLMSLGGTAQAFSWLRQAFLRADGEAVVLGPSGSVQGRISRAGGASETVLYETGRTTDFPAQLAVNWNGLAGAGSGNALITRTSSGALARLEQNKAEILRSPGDVLSDGSVIDWIGVHAAAPNGDVVLESSSSRGPRLYLFRQPVLTEVIGPAALLRLQANEEVAWFNGRLAMNDRGQIAAFIRVRDTARGFESDRVVLFSGSDRQARTVYSPGSAAPGGGTLGWPNQMAVDDQGRVWFTSQAGASTESLFVWDNGTIRRLHNAGDPLPDGRRFPGFGGIRYINGRLYFSSWFPNSANALMETDGSRLRYTISHLEPTSFGAQINYFPMGGQFRVAASGDIAYIAQLSGQPQALIVRKADGRDVIVARQGERVGSGPWIDSFLDAAWSDQNRLFFTAATVGSGDRIDVFSAVPQ